jgi:protein involved in temperature-dependent protein secretion
VAFIYLALVAIVFVGGTILLRKHRRTEPPADADSAENFRDHCQRLLETNKLDELIAYARDRIKKRPNHTYAHWFLARALYLQQKWTEALMSFNEVARLDPSWIEDSVTPYVRAIEAKLLPKLPKQVPAQPENPEQQRTLH